MTLNTMYVLVHIQIHQFLLLADEQRTFFLMSLAAIVKFIYSEKAINFCEISTVDLSYIVAVKSTVEISQNFVAFSEYMNFVRVCKRVTTATYSLEIDNFLKPVGQ